MGLIKLGNIPLTPLGLEKMRLNLGYAGAGARKLYQPDRTKAFDPQSPLSSLLVLVRASTMIATFKAGNKRKTTQSHIFLPKNYSGDPSDASFNVTSDITKIANCLKKAKQKVVFCFY